MLIIFCLLLFNCNNLLCVDSKDIEEIIKEISENKNWNGEYKFIYSDNAICPATYRWINKKKIILYGADGDYKSQSPKWRQNSKKGAILSILLKLRKIIDGYTFDIEKERDAYVFITIYKPTSKEVYDLFKKGKIRNIKFHEKSRGCDIEYVIKSKLIQKYDFKKYDESEFLDKCDMMLQEKKKSKPPKLKVFNVSFKDKNDDKVLSAGESGELVFDIVNAKGAGRAFGVKVESAFETKSKGITFKDIMVIGDIQAGKKEEVHILINASLDIKTGIASMILNVTEMNGFNANSVKIEFETHKLEPPNLILSNLGIDDGFYPKDTDRLCVGNGNNKVELGESIEVAITLFNNGTGPTQNTTVSIDFDNRELNYISNRNDFKLGNISPGEEKNVNFAFSVSKRYKGPTKLPIIINITEKRPRFNKDIPLEIKINKMFSIATYVKIEGKYENQYKNIKRKKSYNKDLLKIKNCILNKDDNVAIVDFEGQNMSAMDARVITGFLRTVFVKADVCRVLDRSNMEAILNEQNFQYSGCTTEDCAVKIGKLLNVKKIIIGTVSKLVNKYYITGNMVNVETGQIIKSERVQCSSPDDLVDIMDLLAVKILSK